ncbi:MAG: hypothetical protein WA814_11535 [Candidatus Baltobacteraceae bacterium]
MKRWGAVAAVAALIAALPRSAAAVDTVPFTQTENGLIEVQASVDNQPAVPMLLDLGAGVDVLSTALGRRLVNVNGKYVSLRLTGERADIPIGTVVAFAIGDVGIEAPHVGIWSGLDGTPYVGMISATAFRNITATFDYRNNKLTIEDAQTFPARKLNAVRVPLVLQDDLGIALGVFARFDFGNGKSGLCEIDTGAHGITIDKALAPMLGVNLNAPGVEHASAPSGDTVRAKIASIGLTGAPQTTIHAPTVTFGNLIYDCNVGNEFWTGRSFTLDLPDRAIFIPAT